MFWGIGVCQIIMLATVSISRKTNDGLSAIIRNNRFNGTPSVNVTIDRKS